MLVASEVDGGYSVAYPAPVLRESGWALLLGLGIACAQGCSQSSHGGPEGDAGPPPLCCVGLGTGNIAICGMSGVGSCGFAACPSLSIGGACSNGTVGCGSSGGGSSGGGSGSTGGSNSSGGGAYTDSIVACPICSSGILDVDVNSGCEGNTIVGSYEGHNEGDSSVWVPGAPVGGQYPLCACPGSTTCRNVPPSADGSQVGGVECQ